MNYLGIVLALGVVFYPASVGKAFGVIRNAYIAETTKIKDD